MFMPSADFSYISTSVMGKLKVSDIKHKAFVNFDENGTEATSVTGKNDNNSIKYKYWMILDFCSIRAQTTNMFCHLKSLGYVFEYRNGDDTEDSPSDIKAVKFHACHPFMFIIKKNTNIIFMGRLSNPNA